LIGNLSSKETDEGEAQRRGYGKLKTKFSNDVLRGSIQQWLSVIMICSKFFVSFKWLFFVAQILHIAVDTESNEGCVYIKCKSTDEAAKVFSALHGQWYAGNLVTVKYMREERYHERFPDSKHHTNPLRPAPPKLKPI